MPLRAPMPKDALTPKIADSSKGATKIKNDGYVAVAVNEKTGLAKNITSGPGREPITQKNGVRAHGVPNVRGVAGGQHAGGHSDVAGTPKVPGAFMPQGKQVVKGGK